MMKIFPTYNIINNCITILLLSCLSAGSYADDRSILIGDLYHTAPTISFSTQYEYSNNVYQQSNSASSGYNQQLVLSLAYQLSLTSTDIVFDYQAYDYRYSDNSFDHEQYWTGHSNLNQRLFNNNISLSAGHFRQRYIDDENGADIPTNQSVQDQLTLSGVWQIPYSARAGFELNDNAIIINYPDAQEQDSERNTAGLTWFNHLSQKSKLQLDSSYSKVNFPFYDQGYEQIESDISFSGNLRSGSYDLSLGYSHLAQDTNLTEGFTYKLNYNYAFNNHSFSAFAQQELTDSSIIVNSTALENNNSLNDSAQILWHDRIKLEHLYNINTRGMNNKITLYFSNESSAFTTQDQTEDDHSLEVSITNQFTLPMSNNINTHLSVSYQDIDLQEGSNKQQWQSIISNDYTMSKHVILSLMAEYTDVTNNQRQDQYDEWRYSSKITLTY